MLAWCAGDSPVLATAVALRSVSTHGASALELMHREYHAGALHSDAIQRTLHVDSARTAAMVLPSDDSSRRLLMQAEFLFDVGSPHAYLAHKRLPEIEARLGLRFEYVPVLLSAIYKATGNRSPRVAFENVPTKLAYEELEIGRYVSKFAIPFQWNPHFMFDTRLLMRVITAAQLDGALGPCLDAVMHHSWAQPKKLDDVSVLRDALHESGLEAERLIARAQEPDVKAALIERTEAAVQRGAFGVPTFFVDGAMYFGKDRLPDIEEAVRLHLR
jgi:2-hydroxychromene-2-carboxylate isomerase